MDLARSPLFIVFDGMDGTGKTTQMRLLAERLSAEGIPVELTAEPTDMEDGRRLRRLLSGKEIATNSEIATLFLLDRITHNTHPERGIGRRLADGVTVLCDRYYYSSIAYQGIGESFEWVARMNLDCPDVRRPDGCIFFDMDPAASMARIRAGRSDDALEIYETVAQQERIRARYARVRDYLADRECICTVDADGTVEEVALRVWEAYEAIRRAHETQKND